MNNKICLVTGANAGIGKYTAIGLAKKGATVVMVSRNEEKGLPAVEEVKKLSGNSNIDLLCCDLSSQAQIRKLAKEFLDKYDQLDVLVNNAGAVYQKFQLSEDGIELQFAVNHLAYFLLTNLLLDVLKKSAPSRIVNVSSEAHKRGIIDFDNLKGEKGYNPIAAYAQSKLANILFTKSLANRLEDTGVTANCLHPGVVRTGIGIKHSNFVIKALWKLITSIPFYAISEEKGAETSLYLATSPEVGNISGEYFGKCKVKQSAPLSRTNKLAEKLWEKSAELTNLQPFLS